MLEDLKVGDKVVRVIHGFRDELWTNDARVTAIDDKQITCIVFVDVPRTMRFDLMGVNVLGKQYGWIEVLKEKEK